MDKIFCKFLLQIACILKRESDLPTEKIVNYIKNLQQPNGGFFGDKWGELDSRFSFCATACLSLLVNTFVITFVIKFSSFPQFVNKNAVLFQGRLDAIDLESAVNFVMACSNFDGGFGSRPDSESHAGLIYCCVGFLSITSTFSFIITLDFSRDEIMLVHYILKIILLSL